MQVDWRQLRHAYLLAAMIYLSIVLLTNSTGWNHLLVLAALAGHAYLASQADSLEYFKRLLKDGLGNDSKEEARLRAEISQQWARERTFQPESATYTSQFSGFDDRFGSARQEEVLDLNRSRHSLEDSFTA